MFKLQWNLSNPNPNRIQEIASLVLESHVQHFIYFFFLLRIDLCHLQRLHVMYATPDCMRDSLNWT